jgi:hypothetical protein
MQQEGILQEILDVNKRLADHLARLNGGMTTMALRKASDRCHVEYEWLLDRVQRGDIVAYRPGPNSSWRVNPDDVNAYLTRTSNQRAERVSRRGVGLRARMSGRS